MFSVITNIYNKKTKGPTLMVNVHSHRKTEKVNMLTRVWQQLEYRIDVCRVTRDPYVEHL